MLQFWAMSGDPSPSAYQDLILEHARQPRGVGELVPCDKHATGVNRLCGDEVTVYLRWDAQKCAATGFTSKGCALCRASASVLMEATHGLSESALRTVITDFRQSFSRQGEVPPDLSQAVRALYDLRRYPARERCVLLAWDTLFGLLNGFEHLQ